MILLFLSSGLFLGWSLGANDAANVFGTAVGSKMVRFRTAAVIASIFVILGAVIGGGGAAHTLGKLGSVNAIAGSFMVAFAAGFTVMWMTKLQLPVSTSQAIVGAIIGWNLFSGSLTDYDSLTKILLTWVLCPVLSAVISAGIFWFFKFYMSRVNIHILRIDSYTRIGLILVGTFGAYSLGANNIANVMGVFIPAQPLDPLTLGWFSLSGTQLLFLLGGFAIAFGIMTYSKKVMDTVGGSLMKISPMAAFIIVLSQAIVLFLFSSERLENLLLSNGLPAIPLVPVSSSQAVVGAVIGIGIIKGGRGIRYKILAEIATGWITTPIVAGLISFVALFFLQNVFNQKVYTEQTYKITHEIISYANVQKINIDKLKILDQRQFYSAVQMESALKEKTNLKDDQILFIIQASQVVHIFVDPAILAKTDRVWLGEVMFKTLQTLQGKKYVYKWQFMKDLEQQSSDWALRKNKKINKLYNKRLMEKRDYVLNQFTSRQ